MPRNRPRIDGDTGGIHHQIVAALRDAGCSVLSLAGLGKGAPDLLVGMMDNRCTPGWGVRYNILLEIKDGSKSPSRRKLTQEEKEFHRGWRGQVCVVESVDEALAAVGVASE